MSIDYSLALELKDAGFPQNPRKHNERPDSWIDSDGACFDWETGDPTELYVPTLEELIEECGRDLEAIIHQQSHAGSEWIAVPFYGDRKRGQGKTPLEAVARFYVVLNKKKPAQTETSGGGD